MLFDWPRPTDYGTCDRCGRRMIYCWSTLRGLRSSDIDEDACEDCGEEIVAACIRYHEIRRHSPEMGPV